MSGNRIVIVGAGFGGMQAARKLTGHGFQIVLVDRHNYHLFQPLLYQVATAGLEPEHVAKSVRTLLRGRADINFRMAVVKGINLEERQVDTGDGALLYDYLILAAGAENHSYGIPGVEEYALPLKNLDDAVRLRNHLLRSYERATTEQNHVNRRAWLNFSVVGGGATGVEMAGALSELIEHVMQHDFPEIDFNDVAVLLLEARPRLLDGMDASLARSAMQELGKKGVQVHLGARVLSYDGSSVAIEGEEPILTHNLIWTAGVRASRLIRELDIDHGPAGRAIVDPSLQLPDHPEVFVIGDAAYPQIPGEPLPMMAPVAQQMADHAASNIIGLRGGNSPTPFRYRDPGRLATIGRNAAVAQVGGFKFRGFPAWLVWLVVHLLRLIGFRNRLMVFLSWVWEYLFYDRAVRLIHGDQD